MTSFVEQGDQNEINLKATIAKSLNLKENELIPTDKYCIYDFIYKPTDLFKDTIIVELKSRSYGSDCFDDLYISKHKYNELCKLALGGDTLMRRKVYLYYAFKRNDSYCIYRYKFNNNSMTDIKLKSNGSPITSKYVHKHCLNKWGKPLVIINYLLPIKHFVQLR